MIIYLFEYVSIFALWRLRDKNLVIGSHKIPGKYTYLKVMFLLFFLTMALRGTSVGTDNLVYSGINAYIRNTNNFFDALDTDSLGFAPVYIGIHYFGSRLVNFNQLSTIINSLIICIGFYYYIKNNSNDYQLSVFLFFSLGLFFESMNGTRQFMAIAIMLNSYTLLKQNLKSFPGWVLFLLSIGVHNTVFGFSLIILLSIWNKRIKNTKQCIFLAGTVAVGIFLLLKKLINIIVNLFPYFSIYINGTNGSQLLASSGNGRIAIVYISLGAIMIMANYFLKSQKKLIYVLGSQDTFASFLCVFLGTLFSTNILVNRIIWQYMCVILVYLPNLLSYVNKKNRFYIKLGLILIFSVYCSAFLWEDKSGIVPYIFFWA